MKNLVINKLIIVSEKNKEAKIIEFDNKLTVITGDNPEGVTINRTGKSLVMKSIYHSLGAKLKKYTANWKDLGICTIINFKYDNNHYVMYRNKERFILDFNGEIKIFNSTSELRQFYVDFFNFHMRLKVAEGDENVTYAYPGAIFMPFYIDQDEGWAGSWDSFKDVFGAKWKNDILLYHLGVRTPKYYDLLDEKNEIGLVQGENKREEVTMAAVIKSHTERYKDYLDITVNLDDFAEDIANLTNELSMQLSQRNKIKENLVECFNDLKEYDELYLVAQKVYNEMRQDVEYIENEIQEDAIICPTCGISHANSVQNRFNIYSEIEECEEVMELYFIERSKIEKRVEKEKDKLQELEDYINNINQILNRKREAITFKEIIVAEGSKVILEDMRDELSKIKHEIACNKVRLSEITKEQTKITKEGKSIKELYLKKLAKNLEALNVVDIEEKDLKTFKPSFSSGGNDLPCAILAQVYSLYSVATKYSKAVLGPIVLDAIFQQEPAKDKITGIWDFTLSSQPTGSQLIISTTEMHGQVIDGRVITLTEERGLLNEADYMLEQVRIDYFRDLIINIKDKNLK